MSNMNARLGERKRRLNYRVSKLMAMLWQDWPRGLRAAVEAKNCPAPHTRPLVMNPSLKDELNTAVRNAVYHWVEIGEPDGEPIGDWRVDWYRE